VTHRLSFLMAAAVLGITPAAWGYSIQTVPGGFIAKWTTPAIGYYVNPVGSDNISNGSDVAAIMASFSDWTALSCSTLTLEKLGNTNAVATNGVGTGSNNKNDILWIETDTWNLGQYVLGVTTPVVYTNGHIVEADVAFNGYLAKWTTTGQYGRADVKSVAIHEIGHSFGLQHNLNGSPYDPPTMAPAVDPYGATATLATDDEMGACFLYPAGGSWPCSSDDMCPYVVDTNPTTGQEFYADKLTCNGTLCAFGSAGGGGTKTLGETCSSQTECASPFFCQPLQSGPGYCAKSCDPSAQDCPGGFQCFPYQSSPGGACLPSDEPLKPNGDFCNANEVCESGLCYPNLKGSWQCRAPCVTTSQCDAGLECFSVPGYPSGGCLPQDEVPQLKVQDGDPCNANEDCESGVCVVNPKTAGPHFCRAACLPNTASACGFGWTCIADGPKGGACVPETSAPAERAALGEACDQGADCQSETCFVGTCRAACNVANPGCPEGQACQRVSQDGIAGVCLAAGPTPTGQPCTADSDCALLFCVVVPTGTIACAEPCPFGSDQCAEGFSCTSLSALSTLGACADANGQIPADTGASVDTGGGTTGIPSDTGQTTTEGGQQPQGQVPTLEGGSRRAAGCTATSNPSSGCPSSGLATLLLLLAALFMLAKRRYGHSSCP